MDIYIPEAQRSSSIVNAKKFFPKHTMSNVKDYENILNATKETCQVIEREYSLDYQQILSRNFVGQKRMG